MSTCRRSVSSGDGHDDACGTRRGRPCGGWPLGSGSAEPVRTRGLMPTAVAQEPWRVDPSDVAAALDTDVDRGLSSGEAGLRLERYGRNELQSPEIVPPWRRLVAQFADPLIYLLLAAVVVSIVAWAVEGSGGLPFDAIVIFVIVVLNGVLGYVQEARAEEAVAALQ